MTKNRTVTITNSHDKWSTITYFNSTVTTIIRNSKIKELVKQEELKVAETKSRSDIKSQPAALSLPKVT